MFRVLCPFKYLEPKPIEEAVQILSTYGAKAKVLAGGVDLVARMRRHEIKPEYVVSIQSIPDLDYIQADGAKGLRIGALTTIRSLELSQVIQRDYMLLHEATHQVASIQVKSMGTAVGNLCVGTPASDIACALFAIGAKLRIVGIAGERTVPIEDFFIGVGKTILQPYEIVTEILLPAIPTRAGSAFLKLARTANDIAKVNVAIMLTLANSRCMDAKIAIGSVAPTVIRARKAEESLKGLELEPKILLEASETAAEEVKPITDIRSTAEYRREITKVLVRHGIEKAWYRATAQNGGRKTQ